MDREDEIRATYARFGGSFPASGHLVLRRMTRAPSRLPNDPAGAADVSERLFAYTREIGSMNGRPWVRIVCEGVIVDEGPRS